MVTTASRYEDTFLLLLGELVVDGSRKLDEEAKARTWVISGVESGDGQVKW